MQVQDKKLRPWVVQKDKFFFIYLIESQCTRLQFYNYNYLCKISYRTINSKYSNDSILFSLQHISTHSYDKTSQKSYDWAEICQIIILRKGQWTWLSPLEKSEMKQENCNDNNSKKYFHCTVINKRICEVSEALSSLWWFAIYLSYLSALLISDD